MINVLISKLRDDILSKLYEILVPQDLYKVYDDQSKSESKNIKTYSVIWYYHNLRKFHAIFCTLEGAKKYCIRNMFGFIESETENYYKKYDYKSIDIIWYQKLNILEISEKIKTYIEEYYELVILDTIDTTKTLYVMALDSYIFGVEPFITNNFIEAFNYKNKGYGSIHKTCVNLICDYNNTVDI